MNEQVRELLDQCKTPEWHQDNPTYNHEKFAELVRADEREECAKLCEQSDRYRGEYFAALIRKRAVEAKLKEKTNDKTKTLGTD